MSLLDAIPGLSAHRVSVPAPEPEPVVVAFDHAGAAAVIRSALEEVALAYPAPDPWGWLSTNRPEIIAELKRVSQVMTQAFQAQNMDQVTAAAGVFVRYHLKAWKIYEERPPLIERQDVLFGEVS